MIRSRLHHVIVLIALLRFSMTLIHQMHAGQRSMCGVIVIDEGMSRSTNLGRDAYILIIALGYRHNYSMFYQLPNNNLFTHHMLFSREKPLVKSTAPGLFSHDIFSDLYCYLPFYLFASFIFRSILPKPKNTSLNFICRFSICIYQIISLPIFYLGGTDNPSYASGCKYLFFVCRYHLHCVAWFSHWINTLVS